MYAEIQRFYIDLGQADDIYITLKEQASGNIYGGLLCVILSDQTQLLSNIVLGLDFNQSDDWIAHAWTNNVTVALKRWF